MPSLDCVLFVESLFGSIWAVMLPHFIWSWLSSGSARCPGAPYGGARHRIVLIICDRLTAKASVTFGVYIQFPPYSSVSAAFWATLKGDTLYVVMTIA